MLLVAALLLGACAGGGTTSPEPSSLPALVIPTDPTMTPESTATRAPRVTAAPTPQVIRSMIDVVYESADPRLPDALLDVFAPTKPGSYPVVVMFHGGPGVFTKDLLGLWAKQVAADGYVVFVPTWGIGGAGTVSLPAWEQIDVVERQAACAVEFARSHAADYGGDASTMVLFGHSAGANTSSVIGFNRPAPPDGCPGGETLGPISSIVTYEGDWLLMDAMWGPSVPREVAVTTPWRGLAEHPNLPVFVLISERSGGVVEPPAGNPPVDWRTDRDPADLRERFLTEGPGGGRVDVAQEQAMLHAALAAQGNPTSLTEVPDSDHMNIGKTGMPVLLAILAKAAGRN
jgi:acetyl esterase/lipase